MSMYNKFLKPLTPKKYDLNMFSTEFSKDILMCHRDSTIYKNILLYNYDCNNKYYACICIIYPEMAKKQALYYYDVWIMDIDKV